MDGTWVRGRSHQDPRGENAPRAPSPPETPEPPTSDVFLDAVSEAGGTEGVGGRVTETSEAVRPVAGLGEGTLRLASRTTSWANLKVGTRDVAFRGERSKDLTLGSGPHPVEVRDVSQKLVWQGTVWVFPDDTVELQFSMAAEPAVPARPEAWVGTPVPKKTEP